MKSLYSFLLVAIVFFGIASTHVAHAEEKSNEKVIIYIYKWCPFCKKVQKLVNDHNISEIIEYRDADKSNIKKELLKISGKKTCPYMVDNIKGVSMPGSTDIMNHLKKHYA